MMRRIPLQRRVSSTVVFFFNTRNQHLRAMRHNSTSKSFSQNSGLIQECAHPTLYRLVTNELLEETDSEQAATVQSLTPTRPDVPADWTITQANHDENFFLLKRRIRSIRGRAEENLSIVFKLENKQKGTYRADGERAEPEHYNFTLFITKMPNPSRMTAADGAANHHGGLEFALTIVDGELVLDALCVHRTAAELLDAQVAAGLIQPPASEDVNESNDRDRIMQQHRQLYCKRHRAREMRYRGPYVNELDEDFADELMNYLDDRGIDNDFGDYLLRQAHYVENQNYRRGWLQTLQSFAALPAQDIYLHAFPPPDDD